MANIREIDINKIPARAFIPVVGTKEIMKARPLSRSEKKKLKPGSPDIEVKPFVGSSGLMERSDIVNLFRYTSGKKISLYGWKSDKQYIIYRDKKFDAFAMRVPAGCFVNINGKVVGDAKYAGPYIVCFSDESGGPSYLTATVISAKLFRKMFIIPKSTQLDNILNRSRASKARLAQRTNSGYSQSSGRITLDKPEQNINRVQNRNQEQWFKGQGQNQRQDQMISNNIVQRPQNTSPIISPINNGEPNNTTNGGTKYKIVKQIHNRYGQRKGFIVISSDKKILELGTQDVMKLCNKKLVVNAELVNRNGTVFLRGNNVVLDNLPIVYK